MMLQRRLPVEHKKCSIGDPEKLEGALHGGCPKNRFITTLDGETGLTCRCVGYNAFFGRISPAMYDVSSLLNQRCAPSEAADVLASEACEAEHCESVSH